MLGAFVYYRSVAVFELFLGYIPNYFLYYYGHEFLHTVY